MARSPPFWEEELREKTVLVVGETGDGKSTLINTLRDPARSPAAAMGKNPRGITKRIATYVGRPIGNVRFNIIDTPGVGDQDVTAMDLVGLLEQALTPCGLIGGVDLVVVTTPAYESRVKVGAQIVQLLVKHGFVGGAEKWKKVLLVGTKKDMAKEEELRFFASDVAPAFFGEDVPEAFKRHVLVCDTDYSQLTEVIANLDGSQVQYKPPPPEQMGEALALTLGVNVRELQESCKEIREGLQAQARELNEQLQAMAAQKEQHQREMAEKERQFEEVCRAHAEQMAAAERVAQERRLEQQQELSRLQREQLREMELQEIARRREMEHTQRLHQQQMQMMQAQLMAQHSNRGGNSGGLLGLIGPVMSVLVPVARFLI